jgi:hypothetical protein
VVDANQQSFGIRFEKERPFTPKIAGALVATIRKFASGNFIPNIYKHENDFWIPLHKNPTIAPHLWMHLQWGSPPECHIVDANGMSLIRKSQQGTYTKRKKLEKELPPWPLGLPTGPEGQRGFIPIDLFHVKTDTTSQDEDGRSPGLLVFSSEQKEARDRVARRLKTLLKSKKQRSEKNQLHPADPLEITELERIASGLKANFHRLYDLINVNSPSIEMEDEKGIFTVSLEFGKTPGQWLQDAYDKIRKAKRRLEVQKTEGDQLDLDIKSYEKALGILRSMQMSVGEVSDLIKPLRLKPKQKIINSLKKPHAHIPYRIFRIQNLSQMEEGPRTPGNQPIPSNQRREKRWSILVGKSAGDSDLLVKSAKGHDLWLHAVGTTGSHVIIPGAKLPEPTRLGRLDDPYFFAAAVLAHYYSKNRDEMPLPDTSPTADTSAQYGGEIYFSTRQFIRKKKGMPPGLWLIDKAKTLHVKYSQKDLRDILNCLEQDQG